MTYQRLAGILFRIESPSLYEVVDDNMGSNISICTVAFTGDAWHIAVLMKQGHTICRGPFKSRDAAIGLLAGRRAA